MSIIIPSAVCRHVAKVNSAYRYGLAFLPGQGVKAFLATLVPDRYAGYGNLDKRQTMVPHVQDLGERLVAFYDKDGKSPCKVPAGFKAVITSWPGQNNSFGNADVISGAHASFLEHQGKPKYVVDSEYRESVRQCGRKVDDAVRDGGAALADRWAHLARDGGSSDPVYTNEEIRKGYNSAENQDFFMTHERAYENSFERQHMIEAGLEKK